jgi:isoquinoline 1-oxidoreductase beta subunit
VAVEQLGYGKKALKQGLAVHESFDSVVAYVVQATLKNGQPALLEATAGVHCNFAVHPLNVQAQVQGAALMGLGMCRPGAAFTLKDGVVEQGKFFDQTVASEAAPTGIGEPGRPPLAPAFANALAKLSGKRQRSLPFVV